MTCVPQKAAIALLTLRHLLQARYWLRMHTSSTQAPHRASRAAGLLMVAACDHAAICIPAALRECQAARLHAWIAQNASWNRTGAQGTPL